MEPRKIILIIILLYLMVRVVNCSKLYKEGFQSQQEIKKKSHEIYTKRDIFKPNIGFSTIKRQIPWIDPVIYDNVYKLSLRENLTNSNIEKTFY